MAFTPDPNLLKPVASSSGFTPNANLLRPVGTTTPLPSTNIQPREVTEQDTLGFFADLSDSIFGAGEFGNVIGTEAAKGTFGQTAQKLLAGRDLTPEEEQSIQRNYDPMRLLGSGLQAGALFTPVGTIAKGATAGLKALGLGRRTSNLLGVVTGGAAGGATLDVATGIKEGEFSPDATVIGAALPPAFTATGKALQGLGVLGRELVGAGTGVGGQTIKQYLQAVKNGGEEARVAIDAMRAKVSPEVLVEDAKSALGALAQQRSTRYKQALEQIAGQTKSYDVSPVIQALKKNLSDFNVMVQKTPEGQVLDFSQSAIRFDRPAQEVIRTIFEEMKTFGRNPGDRTAVGIDSLKRAFNSLYSDNSSVRAFTKGMAKETRKVLSQVPGYDDLAKNYEESTELINEITRGLSLGDKTSVETAYKKLISAFRTNNELRQQLLAELDEVSGQYLSSRIAGQQLSELLPRGLMRQVAVGGGVIGLPFGVSLLPLISTILAVSPRIAGELLTVLGVPAKAVDDVLVAMSKAFAAGEVSPGDRLLKKFGGDEALQSTVEDLITNPKLGLSIQDVTRGKGAQATDNTTQSLLAEAKKYKTPEEFVKAQGKPLYHGGAGKIDEFRNVTQRGVYLTPDKKMASTHASFASNYGNNAGNPPQITEAFVTPKKIYKIKKGTNSFTGIENDNLIEAPQHYPDEINKIKANGFDAIQSSDGSQLLVFDASKIKTKSQLTDLWKQANKVGQMEGKADIAPVAALGGVTALGAFLKNEDEKKKDDIKIEDISMKIGSDAPMQVYKARDVDFNDEEIEELRNILYGEISNRPKDKQALEARVIINTALNRIKENRDLGMSFDTMMKVLHQDNQYQALGGKQYELAKRGEADPDKMAVIDEVIEELKQGKIKENTNGAFYYIHNPDGSITYDDNRPLYSK